MIGYIDRTELARAEPSKRKRGPSHLAVRVLDVALSSVALLLLLPWIGVRALAAWVMRGRVFDGARLAGRAEKPFRRLSFPDRLPGRSLPTLWNVLRGEMSMAGPRPLTAKEAAILHEEERARFRARPGVVSPYAVRQRTGVAYEREEEVDREFVERATPLASLGLLCRSVIAAALGGKTQSAQPESIDFFGLAVSNTTMDEGVDWLVGRAESRQATRVAFVNPHCLNVAYTDENYRAVLASASRVFADGIGLRLGARLLGTSMSANVNGTDLFPRLVAKMSEKGLSLFLLGARPGVAAAVAKTIGERFPDLVVAGTRDGYFAPEDEEGVVDEINRSGADVLLVAMGVPGQELWLARHHERLRPSVRIGVGGLFDFYSGRIPRAPAWMREIGLEWAWRLLREPRRMWRRYVVGNPLFLYRAWKQGRREKAGPGRASGAAPILPELDEDEMREELLDRFDVRDAVLSFRSLRVRSKGFVWRTVIGFTYLSKRILDILASGALLAALSPVFLAIALLLRLDSPGPVLFSQTRIGRWGRPFTLYKFRSMFVDAEQRLAVLTARNEMAGGVLFKMKSDPRVTRVGSWLRKLSLDELPQLWNVFKGDMSLVGPRPPLPKEVAQYSLSDRRRLEVIPGITCIWQVSGRSEIEFARQVELDVAYIESQSLWTDCLILLKTIPAVLSGHGAY